MSWLERLKGFFFGGLEYEAKKLREAAEWEKRVIKRSLELAEEEERNDR
jgi:hypothetical protein